MDLTVKEETNTFRFHAKGLEIHGLTLTQDSQPITTSYEDGENGLTTVTSSQALSPGKYGLDVAFTSMFDRGARSLYKVETDGNSYTFTQFESEYAREAFPCWDEPIFKIPFQMTLVVPKDHLAISNTPIKDETTDGGYTTVVFAKTRPMPSYLLAVATGPFDTVDIPGMSIPGRVVTVKGQTHLAVDAVKATPRILTVLEEYFGGPYPYSKLDLLAVPEFLFGAMENIGAVTYRDDLLLMDPAKASVNQRRYMTAVTAHELAHMWFGNLVTMEWWDDIWLNEAFATWMGYKATDVAYPEYQFTTEDVDSRQGAMSTDALPSARPVRHEFRAGTDPMLMFDELTYQKGQAVLSMVEQWIGEESFRKGMTQYMKKHAWKNATADDLWDALSSAADIDVGATMGSFVDQAGVPLVKVEPQQENLIRLSQQRFENYGQDTGISSTWNIPVTLRYSDGEETYSQKVLLTEETQTVELLSHKEVAWVHPNGNERGYYRWDAPFQMLVEMAANASETLTLRERMGFVNNLSALLDAGTLGGAEYLQAISHFADDPEPQVSAAVVDAVAKVRRDFVTDDLEADFAVYVRQTLRPILDRIGMDKQDGEEGTVSRLRPQLVRWLGGVGNDEEVKAYALQIAEAYDHDRSSIDPSLISAVLALSARYGDAERFEHYRKRFEDAQTPAERRRYLTALGSFQDPKLVQAALEYTLGPSVKADDKMVIPFTVAQGFREQAVGWSLANYDRVEESVPPLHLSYMMPGLADGRSERLFLEVRSFLYEGDRTTPLMEKQLKKVNDRVTRRVRVREKEGESIAAYLAEIKRGG
jgi:alanyl aminopeptidase